MSVADRVDEDDPEFCPHFADGTQKGLCPTCNGHEQARRKAEQAANATDAQITGYPMITRYGFQCAVCGAVFGPGVQMLTRRDKRRCCTDCAPKGTL